MEPININKTLLFFFFILSTLSVVAQSKKTSAFIDGSIERNFYQFNDLTIVPDYSYTKLFAHSFGFGVKKSVKEKMILRLGSSYNRQGYQLNYNYNARQQGDPLVPITTTVALWNARFLVAVGYSVFENERWKFAPYLGLNTMIAHKQTEHTTYGDKAVKATSLISAQLTDYFLTATADFEIERTLNEHIYIDFGPVVGKALKPLNENTMKSGQLSIGVRVGVTFK